jgi:hypothetical protein
MSTTITIEDDGSINVDGNVTVSAKPERADYIFANAKAPEEGGCEYAPPNLNIGNQLLVAYRQQCLELALMHPDRLPFFGSSDPILIAKMFEAYLLRAAE